MSSGNNLPGESQGQKNYLNITTVFRQRLESGKCSRRQCLIKLCCQVEKSVTVLSHIKIALNDRSN